MHYSRFFKYEAHCRLTVVGPDAKGFLQGQFSNDLSALEVNESVYGLWLDRKGKIVADSFVLCRGQETFLAVSYFCDEAVVHDRLDAYLIMEEAELKRSGGATPALCVFGEAGQSGVCSSLGLSVPDPGSISERAGVVAFWGRRGREAALEFIFTGDDPAGCLGKAIACLEGLEAVALEPCDWSALAIEAKIPQIGIGFGEGDLPQELGLEVDAVSFRKGCYLGQEVMARLHAMGRVRKGLRIVSIDEVNTVCRSALPLDLLDESGKKQGQLRTVAYSETGGIGLAVVSLGFVGEVLWAGGLVVRLSNTEEVL